MENTFVWHIYVVCLYSNWQEPEGQYESTAETSDLPNLTLQVSTVDADTTVSCSVVEAARINSCPNRHLDKSLAIASRDAVRPNKMTWQGKNCLSV